MEACALVGSWVSECAGVLHDSPFPFVVFALVFNREGKILTVQDPYDGIRLPGGPVGFEETLYDAVTRCVWEQTGLIVAPPTMWDIVGACEADQERCVTFSTQVEGATSMVKIPGAAWRPTEDVLSGVYGAYNATYLGDTEDE